MSGDSIFGWNEVGFPYRNEQSRSTDVEDVAASSIGMRLDLRTAKEKTKIDCRHGLHGIFGWFGLGRGAGETRQV